MVGAVFSACALAKYGVDTTIKSKRLGTLPPHWLFVFEPETIYDIAVLLTSKDTSVLMEFSTLNLKAFRFLFKWPVGTPLKWAVLFNCPEAVNVLVGLGSIMDTITDFFPEPPDWTNQFNGTNPGSWDKTDGPEYNTDDRKQGLSSIWIYHDMGKYPLHQIQSSLSYQTQFDRLSSKIAKLSRKRELYTSNTFGGDLISAMIENDLDSGKKLITAGADVNQVSRAGLGLRINALMSAINQRNPTSLNFCRKWCSI